MDARRTMSIMTAVVCGLLLGATAAQGANGTWNPTGLPANGSAPTFGHLWSDSTQWTGGIIPGTVGTTDNTDTVNFLIAGHYTIELNANHNVKTINSDPGGHGHAFGTQNGSVLSLTSGGAINNTGGGNDKYFAPIRLEGGAGGSYTFSGAAMKIYAPVTGTATAGNYDLILSGAGTANEVATSGSYVGSLGNGGGGGTLSVIKTGAGTWFLKNANTYTGTTTVRNGTLSFGTAAAFGTGTSAINLGDSSTGASDNNELRFITNDTLARNVVVNNNNPSGTTTISARDNLGTPTLSGTLTLNRTLTIYDSGSGFLTFSGKITGTGGLIKDGPDRATLSGTLNDYQGGATLNAGLLIASGAGALGTGPVAVNGGVLRANDGVGLSTAINLPLNNGVWESGASITRTLGSGAGKVQLAGYAGFSANGANINVNLNSGSGLAWGSTTGFSPTTLVLNETTAANQITLQNAVDLNGANRTIAANANTAVISGAIGNTSGTAGLTKNGAGTLNLTGRNTFNGGLTLNAGALNIKNTNTLVSAVTVNAGTLTVDYTGQSTGASLIPAAAPLTIGGGTFSVTGSGVAGQTTAQTVNGLTLAASASTVSAVASSSRPVVLNLGAISRTVPSAAVNFVLPAGTQDAANGITTSSGTANTKLGVWATVNGTEWAAKDAENDNIVTWSSVGGTYTDVTRLSSGAKTIASNPASDVRVIDGTGTAASITPAAPGTTDIATLFGAVTGGTATYDPGTSDILRLSATGTVALTGATGTGALTIGAAINDGILTAGGAANTAGTLTFVNNSAANLITVNSSITDNGTGAVGVRKLGPGIVAFDGTSTVNPPTLGHSGGTFIGEGTLRYRMRGGGANTTVDYQIGTGNIHIQGGTLHADYAGNGRPATVRITNPIGVGASGATFNMRQAAGAGHVTFSGAQTLGGNLRIEGQAVNDQTVMTTTLGGLLTLTNSVSITFASPTFGLGGLTWNDNAVSGGVAGGSHSITFTGPGNVALSNGGANFAPANFIVDNSSTLVYGTGNTGDFFSGVRGNAGKVTLNAARTLSVTGQGNWTMSDFVFNSGSVLVLDMATSRPSGDSGFWQLNGSFTIGSPGAGQPETLRWILYRVQNFRVRDGASLGTITVGNGGTFQTWITESRYDTAPAYDGNLRLQNGAVLDGRMISGITSGAGERPSGLRRAAGTLLLGDGVAGTAETVTIQGVTTWATNLKRPYFIDFANNTTDDGNVVIRYASVGTDPSQYFNVGWMHSGGTLVALREGSSGTVFAPATQNAGVAAVGPAAGTVFTAAKPVTVTTAGTVGFHNVANLSGTGGGERGALGPLEIGATGSLAFQAAGKVQASSVTFKTGAALTVRLTGTSATACSLVDASGTLTFESGTSIAITEEPGLSAYKGPWYVAKGASLAGLPNKAGGLYRVTAEGGYVRIDRLAAGTLILMR